MPARVYQYYEIESFPSWEIGFEFRTDHQDTLLPDHDESPQTIIKNVGLADSLKFLKFHVIHETIQNVQGRYRSEQIKSFIKQIEFHLFIYENQHRLLIDAPRKICHEMVNRVDKNRPEFCLIPRKIDLVRLGDDLRAQIRGGWFGDLKVADVKSIGMFGPTVGESGEWKRANNVGLLKAVDVDFYDKGETLLVKIMGNRGIVHYKNLSESSSLEWVLSIQKALDQYEITNLKNEK